MGEICNYHPTNSNFFTLQWFSIGDEWSERSFVSFFVEEKLNTLNITCFSWQIRMSVRAPPFLSEIEK